MYLWCSGDNATYLLLRIFKPEISYESIYNGNLKTQMEIFKRFKNSLESRNKIKNGKNYPPGDLRDPLSCINLDMDNK